MPRLFTGIEVPRDVAASLSMLRGGLPGARWVDPETYHMTLRFIGDVDHALARDLAEALDEIAARPIPITLDALDSFGGGRPRVVLARARPNRALSELQAEHERAARVVGLPPEPRKFTPHVTLARLRDASPLAVADWLGSRAIGRPLAFTADRFMLFSSRSGHGGPPYVVEAEYALGERSFQDGAWA
jgi:2'-5' RNA ligase